MLDSADEVLLQQRLVVLLVLDLVRQAIDHDRIIARRNLLQLVRCRRTRDLDEASPNAVDQENRHGSEVQPAEDSRQVVNLGAFTAQPHNSAPGVDDVRLHKLAQVSDGRLQQELARVWPKVAQQAEGYQRTCRGCHVGEDETQIPQRAEIQLGAGSTNFAEPVRRRAQRTQPFVFYSGAGPHQVGLGGLDIRSGIDELHLD
mmetsp:Transcript_30842/g.43179  ORF Transcript_30842/g.43179 Transcript_30842/m.43179 type:complete len:202 (+) Transcript_30842:569-1174(+)